MRRAFILLIVGLFLFADAAGARDFNKRGGSQTCTLSVNGVTRQYLLYIPANLPLSPSLLIYLHGAHGGMWKGQNMGWNTKAAAAGVHRGLSAGAAQQLGHHLKVFVTGYSLGAFMANRVGVELGSLVAAIAPVSGELWMNTGGPVPGAAAPISVLLLKGSADTSVPYCGMTTPYPEASEDDTFNYWQTQNVCMQTTAALCSGGKVTTISSKTATGCSSSVVAEEYELIGGIHKWYEVNMNVPPGTSTQPYNPKFKTSTGLTTNDIIWDFFVAHPKP